MQCHQLTMGLALITKKGKQLEKVSRTKMEFSARLLTHQIYEVVEIEESFPALRRHLYFLTHATTSLYFQADVVHC